MAAYRVGVQYALFACYFYSKSAGAGWPFQVFGKPKSSVLSLLDLVFCNLAPLELPHCAMERGRSFRRVRMGPLVPQKLRHWPSISAGMVSYCDFARDAVSLLCLGISEAFRL